MRALDQPSTSAAAFSLNPDDETAAATPMECSRSETDVEIVDLLEVSDVQSRQDFEKGWSHSNRYLDEAFLKNDFDHACYVCDRLWFRKDLKSPTIAQLGVLRTEFVDPSLAEFSVCNTCHHSLNSKITPLAKIMVSCIRRSRVACPLAIPSPKGSFHLGYHLCKSEDSGTRIINLYSID